MSVLVIDVNVIPSHDAIRPTFEGTGVDGAISVWKLTFSC